MRASGSPRCFGVCHHKESRPRPPAAAGRGANATPSSAAPSVMMIGKRPIRCSSMVLPIPADNSLIGLDLFAQSAVLNNKAWSMGVTSNALHTRIGNY